jgi:sugar lactone lactonase YvrE
MNAEKRPSAALSTLALITLLAGCPEPVPPAMGDDDVMPDAGTDPVPDAGEDCDVPFTSGVSMLAGCSAAGYADGTRAVARFANPVNVAYRDGTLYVADFDNGKLRAIDVATHATRTVIAQAGFQRPFGLAFAADGTFYVSTDDDQVGSHSPLTGSIWKIDLVAKTATIVANAIGRPRGIAVLADGRIAASDYQHHVVEVVDPLTGLATIVAGTWDVPGSADGVGAAARFNAPYGIAVRGDGLLVVADYGNNTIRLVGLDGTTTTLAGAAAPGYVDGTSAAARFNHPQGVSIAADGAVYLTDAENFRVRRIVGGQVETVAGDGQGGYLDADDPLASRLHGLEGLSVVPDGSMLYVADGDRGEGLAFNRVRQITLD